MVTDIKACQAKGKTITFVTYNTPMLAVIRLFAGCRTWEVKLPNWVTKVADMSCLGQPAEKGNVTRGPAAFAAADDCIYKLSIVVF